MAFSRDGSLFAWSNGERLVRFGMLTIWFVSSSRGQPCPSHSSAVNARVLQTRCKMRFIPVLFLVLASLPPYQMKYLVAVGFCVHGSQYLVFWD